MYCYIWLKKVKQWIRPELNRYPLSTIAGPTLFAFPFHRITRLKALLDSDPNKTGSQNSIGNEKRHTTLPLLFLEAYERKKVCSCPGQIVCPHHIGKAWRASSHGVLWIWNEMALQSTQRRVGWTSAVSLKDFESAKLFARYRTISTRLADRLLPPLHYVHDLTTLLRYVSACVIIDYICRVPLVFSTPSVGLRSD